MTRRIGHLVLVIINTNILGQWRTVTVHGRKCPRKETSFHASWPREMHTVQVYDPLGRAQNMKARENPCGGMSRKGAPCTHGMTLCGNGPDGDYAHDNRADGFFCDELFAASNGVDTLGRYSVLLLTKIPIRVHLQNLSRAGPNDFFHSCCVEHISVKLYSTSKIVVQWISWFKFFQSISRQADIKNDLPRRYMMVRPRMFFGACISVLPEVLF